MNLFDWVWKEMKTCKTCGSLEIPNITFGFFPLPGNYTTESSLDVPV